MTSPRQDWYPGLMERTRRFLRDFLPHIDGVLEVSDARAPMTVRWHGLAARTGRLHRLLILNKADLAEPEVTRRWLRYFDDDPGEPLAVSLNSTGRGAGSESRRLRSAIMDLGGRGKRGRALKVTVVGVPNVGKSSVLNLLAGGRQAAKTGARPGLTRGQQWIVVSPDLWLLDLPGVLPPSPRDGHEVALLALTATIPEGAYDPLETAAELLRRLLDRHGREATAGLIGLDQGEPPGETLAWLSAFAARRGLLGRGGR